MRDRRCCVFSTGAKGMGFLCDYMQVSGASRASYVRSFSRYGLTAIALIFYDQPSRLRAKR